MASTILVVDDDLMNQISLEAILANQGYNLEMANNGYMGLKKAEELLPDVILLDIMMPGMDGFEMCRLIRQNKKTAEIPIVIITGLDDQLSRLRGLEAGADEFISKPFNSAELRIRLATITRLNRFRSLINERTQLAEALCKLENAYEDTLAGFSRALDLRDHQTGDHSLRLANLSVEIARLFGIPEDELIHIKRGALLHDIGKIGIPDSILMKTDSLNSAEMEIMQKHPGFAQTILEPIRYLAQAQAIPACHHEKWDGSGYPLGLKGEEIPLCARIFAVVDAWDALLSDRHYRPAWTKQMTLDYLRDRSGKDYDPQVLLVFLEYMTKDETAGVATVSL